MGVRVGVVEQLPNPAAEGVRKQGENPQGRVLVTASFEGLHVDCRHPDVFGEPLLRLPRGVPAPSNVLGENGTRVPEHA